MRVLLNVDCATKLLRPGQQTVSQEKKKKEMREKNLPIA